MVERLKADIQEKWPMLLLVLAVTGGGTSLGNLATGGNNDEAFQQLTTLSSNVRELTYVVRSSWSVPMEVSAWDRAGRELRKTIPEWQGPDVIEIRKVHMGLDKE